MTKFHSHKKMPLAIYQLVDFSHLVLREYGSHRVWRVWPNLPLQRGDEQHHSRVNEFSVQKETATKRNTFKCLWLNSAAQTVPKNTLRRLQSPSYAQFQCFLIRPSFYNKFDPSGPSVGYGMSRFKRLLLTFFSIIHYEWPAHNRLRLFWVVALGLADFGCRPLVDARSADLDQSENGTLINRRK